MNLIQGLKTAIMLRKSRADIEEERKAREHGEVYDTLKKHRKELLSFARRNQLDIVDIYEEVVSGDKISDRPQMQLMLERIKQGLYDAVLVIAYDRLGRGDKMDQGYMERIFKESFTIIITPKEVIDLNSEKGEMTADIEGFIARMEYRRIKTRLNDGKLRAVRDGKDMGTSTPFGFIKDKDMRLIHDPNEVEIARYIFKRAIEGASTVRIEAELYEMGVTFRGGSRFQKQTIWHMIRNPKYKGYQHYGKVKNKKLLVPNAHIGIVTEEEWEEANKQISLKNSHNDKVAPMTNPLSTILRCTGCNMAMTRRQTTRKGTTYVYYYCKHEFCRKNAGVKEHDLITELLNHLTQTLQKIQLEHEEYSNSNIPIYKKQLNELNKLLDTYSKRRNKIHLLYEDEEYTKEMFMERKAIVDLEEKETLEKISYLKQQIENEQHIEENVLNFAPSIQNTLDLFHKCSPEQKNRLLKSFIKEIRYTRPTKHDDFTIELFYHE